MVLDNADNTELGMLLKDFKKAKSTDMSNPILKSMTAFVKESEKGQVKYMVPMYKEYEKEIFERGAAQKEKKLLEAFENALKECGASESMREAVMRRIISDK